VISLNDFVAISGFILGLITALAGWLAWYGTAVRKRYAAERDFNHLRRNYEQLAENQKIILLAMDKIGEDVAEIRYRVSDKDKERK
jgi:nitrogen fixation protein FixH